MKLTPDAQHIYVTLPLTGQIVIVDREAERIINTITTAGGKPRRIVFSQGGALALATDEVQGVIVIQ